METFKNLLQDGAKELALDISDGQCDKFYSFYKSVVDYNQRVNLTSILDEKDFVIKHLLDSLTAVGHIPQNSRVCDIGAGAGFPSIPLKLARDDLSLVMMDALNKRVTFLKQEIDELALKNTTAVHIRAEEGGVGEYRNQFDCVVARAVADIKVLCELALPLLKVGGIFIAYKGSNLDELDGLERALGKLKGKLTKVVNLKLPYIFDERNLFIIEKTDITPPIYPRSFSKIKTQKL